MEGWMDIHIVRIYWELYPAYIGKRESRNLIHVFLMDGKTNGRTDEWMDTDLPDRSVAS